MRLSFGAMEQEVDLPLSDDDDADRLHLSFKVDPGDTSRCHLDIVPHEGPTVRAWFQRNGLYERVEYVQPLKDDGGAERNEKRNAEDLERIKEAQAKLDDPDTPAHERAEHQRLADMAPPEPPEAPEPRDPATRNLDGERIDEPGYTPRQSPKARLADDPAHPPEGKPEDDPRRQFPPDGSPQPRPSGKDGAGEPDFAQVQGGPYKESRVNTSKDLGG